MKKFIVAIAAVAAITLASCSDIDNKKTVEENLDGVDTCAVVADNTIVVDLDTMAEEINDTCLIGQ